jgi:hypothetical protein
VTFAALELAYERSMRAAASAYVAATAAGGPWSDGPVAAAIALVARLRSDPTLMYLVFVEPYAIRPEVVQGVRERMMAFTLLLEQGFAQSAGALALPHGVLEAIVSAAYEMTRLQCVRLPERRMPELLAYSAYTALAPFIGPQQAAELVVAKVRPAEQP